MITCNTCVYSQACNVTNNTVILCPMPDLVTDNETRQHEWISSVIETEKPIPQDLLTVSVGLYNDDFSFSFSLPGPSQRFHIYYNPEFKTFEETNGVRHFRTYFPHYNRHMEVKVKLLITQRWWPPFKQFYCYIYHVGFSLYIHHVGLLFAFD